MCGGLIAVADATEAGLRQSLGYDSLPVLVDELEPGENMSAVAGVIRFARISASGGELVRGGVDHKATRFVARSCFMFSSILVPALTPQDRSRIVVLRLGDLRNPRPFVMDNKALAELGTRLLRRIVDQWGRMPQALDAFREALLAEGASARMADVLGTLLAMADLLTADHPVDTDTAREAVLALPIVSDSAEEGGADQDQCLAHLLSTAIPLGSPSRKPVVDLVSEAMDFGAGTSSAAETLAYHGMKVMTDKSRQPVLAVANSNDGLRKIFEGTPWGSRPGGTGVWVQSMRRLPGADRTDTNYKTRIGQGRGAKPGRVTLIPLELILDAKALANRSSLDLIHNDDD